MARIRLALPWSVVIAFAFLFLVAWWIEDCFIYYIDWRSAAVGRLTAGIASGLHLDRAVTVSGNVLRTIGHSAYNSIAIASASISQAFDAVPPAWRAKWPLRFAAWVGFTLTDTFGGEAIGNFGAGILLVVEKGLKLLVALNGACWLYNLGRRGLHYATMAVQMPIRFYSERETENGASTGNVADGAPRSTRQRRREYQQFFGNHVERIGIILAGGGARGAYQAGALKAIYEFLRDYNSLSKVRAIAATSIGAWNAMFWLADMIEPADANSPSLEGWWKSVSFGRLFDFPWFYLPLWSNSLLRAAPWREHAQQIFNKRVDRIFEEDSVHFYFLRCDAEGGAAHYSTNWRQVGARIDELGLDKDDNYRYFDVVENGNDAVDKLNDAIFAGMGLPPLFPPPRVGEASFEDSAKENLPFRFAAPVENCDLLFVITVDGSGVSSDGASITKRLLRSADIRQNMLDRMALKNADLINRMAERMERMEFGIDALTPTVPAEGVAADALSGLREELSEFRQEYRRLYVMSVCANGRLEIGDFGFWQPNQVRDAFDLMYVQVRRELQGRFFEDIEPEDTHVVMVDGAVPTNNELPKPKYRRPAQL